MIPYTPAPTRHRMGQLMFYRKPAGMSFGMAKFYNAVVALGGVSGAGYLAGQLSKKKPLWENIALGALSLTGVLFAFFAVQGISSLTTQEGLRVPQEPAVPLPEETPQ